MVLEQATPPMRIPEKEHAVGYPVVKDLDGCPAAAVPVGKVGTEELREKGNLCQVDIAITAEGVGVDTISGAPCRREEYIDSAEELQAEEGIEIIPEPCLRCGNLVSCFALASSRGAGN